MKKGWQTKTLGEVLQKTETINPLQSPEAEFDYIDVSSVSNSTFEIEATQRLKGKEAPSRARRLVKANDVLFATVRPTLRRIAVVPEHLDNQVCSTGYFVLRPKAGIDPRFVFYSLFTEGFIGQMESLQKGASYPAVTDGEVRAQLIPVPPLPEQHRIVAILDPIGTTIFPKRGGAILTNKKRITERVICADLNIMGVTPKSGLLPEFLFNFFLRLDLREINNGSSIPQINNYSVEPLLIAFPKSTAEQQAIVAKLNSFSEETQRLTFIYQQKLAALEELKKSLLHQAFSGQL